MADLTYTTPLSVTRNRARLVYLRMERLTNPDGSMSGQVQLHGIAQIGNFTSGVFTEHLRVSFVETVPVAVAVSTFTSPTLNAMEAGILSRMQLGGVLPAGTIT